MLNCSKYDVFQYDRSCIFAAVKQNGKWTRVSSILKDSIHPLNESWFSFSNIFNAESENSLNTAVTLLDDKQVPYSFVLSMKVDFLKAKTVDENKKKFLQLKKYEKERDAAKIELIKQGTDQLNGVFDAYLIAANCTDGKVCRLVFKTYFARTDTINLQEFVYDIDEKTALESMRIYFILDVFNSVTALFINEEFKKYFTFSLKNTIGLPLNAPFKDSNEMHHLRIGDAKDVIDLKAIAIFKCKLSNIKILCVKTAISEV